MLSALINKLMLRENLSQAECQTAIELILEGATPEQSAAFLTLLHAKRETTAELNALVHTFKTKMQQFTLPIKTLDIVGTGGDGHNTLNISSAASLVCASLGVPVAKHGNKAVSSKSGSADFYNALGLHLTQSLPILQRGLTEHHFAYFHAPIFHPALAALKPLRQALKVRTTLNLLGPLLNPCQPEYYLLGVYNSRLLPLYAAHLANNANVERALVVHSAGLDELSLIGPAEIVEINGDDMTQYTLTPESFGFSSSALHDIQGKDANYNKIQILNAFSGVEGPIQETIALNAGAALYASKNAQTIQDGIDKALTQIKTGKVIKFINNLISFYHSVEVCHE